MKHFWQHIKSDFIKHTFDYMVLITAGIFFLLALNIFRGERFLIFLVLFAFASFYIIWAMYHHAVNRTIKLKVVVEYILIVFTILFLLRIIIFP